MTEDTEIEWHKEQIAKNRALLEELEAGNTAGGNVFPETRSEIDRLKVLIPEQAAHRFRDDAAHPFRLIAARRSD